MITLEVLEPRRFLSASLAVTDLTNVTRLPGNQEEGAITVDPANPLRVFALSNTDTTGLAAAFSTDGGHTWSASIIADGTSGNLESACCDPTASFDQYGNLFIGYVNADTDAVIIAMSTDGGASFRQIARFDGDIDQPTIATGSNELWMTFAKNEKAAVVGTSVTGLGQVGKFTKVRSLPGVSNGTFGDITIGPRGQVMVAYEINHSDTDNTSILGVSVDPDGLGKQGFGKMRKVAKVNVGPFQKLPAQPTRSVDAEVSIGYDLSNSPYRGRVYAIYTDRTVPSGNDTNIFISYSDNNGSTWSTPQKLNDDTGTASQFLPKLSVDPTTGEVGIGWHDTRNDPANKNADYYATVATPSPTGMEIAPNIRVTPSPSNAPESHDDINFGDYTGISFFNNVLHPIWADNSNATGDNPDGTHHEFDMYSANIAVTPDMPTGDPGSAISGGVAASFSGKPTVKSGKTYSFKVTFSDQAILDTTTLGTSDVTIMGPNGFSQLAKLKTKSINSSATQATVTYTFTAPDGSFKAADNGTYTILLDAGQVSDLLGKSNNQATLGQFTIAAKA